jgi:ribosomal protein S6E (S10)
MFERLQKIFKLHHEKYEDIRKMSAIHINMAKSGLLRIQLALIISMRSDMIESSFKETGIFPFNESIILKNCKTKILATEEKNIFSSLDNLVIKMKTQGEIFESDFDEMDIRKTLDVNGFEVKKDDLVNYRRRSLMLTNINYIAREEGKKNEKLETKNNSIEKKKKNLEKKIEKEIKKNENKILKKNKKDIEEKNKIEKKENKKKQKNNKKKIYKKKITEDDNDEEDTEDTEKDEEYDDSDYA